MIHIPSHGCTANGSQGDPCRPRPCGSRNIHGSNHGSLCHGTWYGKGVGPTSWASPAFQKGSWISNRGRDRGKAWGRGAFVRPPWALAHTVTPSTCATVRWDLRSCGKWNEHGTARDSMGQRWSEVTALTRQVTPTCRCDDPPDGTMGLAFGGAPPVATGTGHWHWLVAGDGGRLTHDAPKLFEEGEK